MISGRRIWDHTRGGVRAQRALIYVCAYACMCVFLKACHLMPPAPRTSKDLQEHARAIEKSQGIARKFLESPGASVLRGLGSLGAVLGLLALLRERPGEAPGGHFWSSFGTSGAGLSERVWAIFLFVGVYFYANFCPLLRSLLRARRRREHAKKL